MPPEMYIRYTRLVSELGDAIREARLRAGLTQTEAAERAATARSNLAAYESGAKTPGPGTAERILRAMRGLPSEVARSQRRLIIDTVRANRGDRVRLIGSAAKHRDVVGSDLDLLVEFQDDATMRDVVRIEEGLADALGIPVDVVSSRVATEEMLATAVDL